MTSSSGRTT